MKKVGIATMCGGVNYGNCLQNYAVQTLLEALGYKAITLNNKTHIGFPYYSWRVVPLLQKLSPSYIQSYRRTKLFEEYGCKNDRDSGGKGLRTAKASREAYQVAQKRRIERFDQFRKNYIHWSESTIDKTYFDRSELDTYTAFVCGSDQVWNPNYLANSMIDFLQFAPEHKRIALAPSIGISELPKQREMDYRSWINGIPHLSVRETTGAELIRKLTGREAKVLLDPTFGLTAEQWRAFSAKPINAPQESFVFCYFLGNLTKDYVREIEKYAKKHHCKVVSVCDIHDLDYYDIDPREFVWLLDHAKMVFTDSFHGTAFSINLQKPFYAYPRVEGGASISSRISSVLSITDLEDRHYTGSITEDTVNFAVAAQVVEQKRKEIYDFLENALHCAEQGKGPLLANRYHCSGCGACAAICPVGAIRMTADAEGFAYPVIDKKKCISCGKCEMTCPADRPSPEDSETKGYFAFSKNEEICHKSSSGGVFSCLAEEIISTGGVVFGAGYDDQFRVCHMEITSIDEIARLRTSKYVQSDTGSTFSSVQRHLEKGLKVLFVGTSCQIAGLKRYLGKEWSQLYTADIICHGVPSPGVWEKYLDDYHRPKGIHAVSFRDKTEGWNDFSMKIEYRDGSYYRKLATKDPFERAFLANLILRPSCYQCQFKTLSRFSDLTLADYWGVEAVHPEWKDQQGVSLVLTHSDKGAALWNAIRDKLNAGETDTNRATGMNHGALHSVKWHRNRDSFFEQWQDAPMKELIGRCLRPTMKERAWRFVIINGSRAKSIIRRIRRK